MGLIAVAYIVSTTYVHAIIHAQIQNAEDCGPYNIIMSANMARQQEDIVQNNF